VGLGVGVESDVLEHLDPHPHPPPRRARKGEGRSVRHALAFASAMERAMSTAAMVCSREEP